MRGGADVADPDLGGPLRYVLFVAVVVLGQVVHGAPAVVVVRGLPIPIGPGDVLSVVVHEALVEVLLLLKPDRHAGAVSSFAVSGRGRSSGSSSSPETPLLFLGMHRPQ